MNYPDVCGGVVHSMMKIGYSQIEIADEMGVHRSTISRELRCNRSKLGYNLNKPTKWLCGEEIKPIIASPPIPGT